MKKILTITLISVVTIMISSGCNSSSPAASAELVVRDAKISEEALYVKIHDSKKILHAIEKAGEKTGWKITEFKSNEVLAEKTDAEDTVSSSIKFADGYVDFSNNDDTSDLREAIKEELSKSSSSH